ncbi:hypothetical protein [Vibrio diazotrophicus]|uniref:hypothetical protein n=1 Tax=Vibrio diazotrophicus TaxID=685 RepID=UPI000C9E0998|nr:hypothetical protein [Vibrio diazotrophicus]PNH79138.1 hypothetical protein C1N27_14560 [Vibrio diazotrophicus]
MKEHSKIDDLEVAEKQKQALDLCQLVDEAFQSGLIKSREDLDLFLDQKLRIVMVSELQNRSENDVQALLEKRKESIVLLALCRFAENDIQTGRGLNSDQLQEILKVRKQKFKSLIFHSKADR